MTSSSALLFRRDSFGSGSVHAIYWRPTESTISSTSPKLLSSRLVSNRVWTSSCGRHRHCQKSRAGIGAAIFLSTIVAIAAVLTALAGAIEANEPIAAIEEVILQLFFLVAQWCGHCMIVRSVKNLDILPSISSIQGMFCQASTPAFHFVKNESSGACSAFVARSIRFVKYF